MVSAGNADNKGLLTSMSQEYSSQKLIKSDKILYVLNP